MALQPIGGLDPPLAESDGTEVHALDSALLGVCSNLWENKIFLLPYKIVKLKNEAAKA